MSRRGVRPRGGLPWGAPCRRRADCWARATRRGGLARGSRRFAAPQRRCAATRCSAACCSSRRRRDRRRVPADDRAVPPLAAADLGGGRGAADPGHLREAHRALRPRRDAAAQDDARRGAEAAPARDAVRARGLALRRAARPWRARPPRGAVPVAYARGGLLLIARGGSRDRAVAGAGRALPVHRRRAVGRDDPLEAGRPRRRQGGRRRASRPRQGRALVDRHLLRAAARRDPRPRADARRPPRDHRAAQRRRRRDAQPRAHAQGGRRPRQRAAAAARGRRLLGRVRRPARRHGDGRAGAST